MLMEIIRRLSSGEFPEALMQQFSQECDTLTQDEVSAVFNQLGREGVKFQNHPQVVDYYHTIIANKLAGEMVNQYTPGHPARVYLEENRLLRSLFSRIHQVDPLMERERFQELFQQIARVELHYLRKENQLFPCLERHGWDSPSTHMWAFHDEIRARIKSIRLALENAELEQVARLFPHLEREMTQLISI